MQVSSNYIKKWTLFCAFGELSGIAMAGFIAFFANNLIGEPYTLAQKLLMLTMMLVAGAIEGSLLGWFQWKVLKAKVPVGKAEWIKITIAVAVFGWFLGMLPSLFLIPSAGSSGEVAAPDLFSNTFVFAVLCIGSGLFLGSVFGIFQWLVLRKYVHKASWWIFANALGWAAGLGWIYAGASLPDEDSSITFHIVSGAAGGVLAGLSVGLVTGLFLKKLILKTATDSD